MFKKLAVVMALVLVAGAVIAGDDYTPYSKKGTNSLDRLTVTTDLTFDVAAGTNATMINVTADAASDITDFIDFSSENVACVLAAGATAMTNTYVIRVEVNGTNYFIPLMATK